MNNKTSREILAVRLSVILLLCLCATTSFASEGLVSFIGDKLKISFQPPSRSGLGDSHPLAREIPHLNLVHNLVENYLEYLIKMKKVASSTNFNLEYAPEGGGETFSSKNRIPIPDLGMNLILRIINETLKNQKGTFRSFLIDSAIGLITIKDQMRRKTDTIEMNLNFTNLSQSLEGLRPEADFELIGNREAVTIRPDGSESLLAKLSMDSSGTVLLERGKRFYHNLKASKSHPFVAFTDGGEVKIINCSVPKASSEKTSASSPIAVSIFNSDSKVLLDMEWSPTTPILAGIVLDKETSDREIFLFDAENNKRLEYVNNSSGIESDYQYAYPYWAPNGTSLLFVSDNEINLIDTIAQKVFPKIVTALNNIAEIIWSPDSRSFAYVEVIGQARDKAEFDDRDFGGYILHRCFLNKSGNVIDDPSQRYISSDTIKLVSFWSLDRILFLEGHLKSQRIQSPLWDMGGNLFARLTPTPKFVMTEGPTANSGKSPEIGHMDLPLEYCYVIKSLDGKFKNIYDAGYGHMNQLFTDRMVTTWFIGLKPPPEINARGETFNLRVTPYPFNERNISFCLDLPREKVKSLVNLIESYNLRRFEISPDLKNIFFLSNSRGPLTLWGGPIGDIGEVTPPQAFDKEDEGEESEEAPYANDETENTSDSQTTASITSFVPTSQSSQNSDASILTTMPSLPEDSIDKKDSHHTNASGKAGSKKSKSPAKSEKAAPLLSMPDPE